MKMYVSLVIIGPNMNIFHSDIILLSVYTVTALIAVPIRIYYKYDFIN